MANGTTRFTQATNTVVKFIYLRFLSNEQHDLFVGYLHTIQAVIILYQVHDCGIPKPTTRSRFTAVCASNRCGACWRPLTAQPSLACSKHTSSKAIGSCLHPSFTSG